MRRYNLLQPLWLSFYSGDIYQDVAQNWRYHTWIYLLILLSISWIPRTLEIRDRVNEWVHYEAPFFIDQIPEFTITEGKVSLSVDGPVLIRDRDSTLFMIIDVSGVYTSLDSAEATVLLTETDLHIRNNAADEIQIQKIPEEGSFTVNRASLMDLTELIRLLITLGFYPAAIFGSYLFRLAQVLVYAGLVRQFSATLPRALSYRTLTHLAVIAITPAVLLDAAHDIMERPFEIWLWWPVCFLLSMGYLVFAIREVGGAHAQEDQDG